MTQKKSKPRTKRTKNLTTILYTYVQAGNAKHAKARGRDPKYGSISGYVNTLIANDRGVKALLGVRGSKGKAA